MPDFDTFPHMAQQPRVSATAFVAPGAVVVYDVEIADNASIWFGAVLRADVQAIRVGRGSNIQDQSVLHASTGGEPCIVGDGCTVGHAAVLHSCTLEDYAFVGFGARVLDGCRIATNGVLAAGAVLTPGKQIGSGELWAGNPARLLRTLTPAESAAYRKIAGRYVALAASYRSPTHT
ncbi:gamma carbonic anhydrase family protein [Pandoraea sp. ISTKB]|uniref:gamma carbonic anhydrase family protein n=1 Tax=Pandoraea sp. ISTKB TaxID=1586708 RepID=UPI00084691E6|nr:gamma carbonic anhydrase family protein [Pandoraea sp. ISTKB]ODP33239.1 gamma carbonic anhydrase family protein [Pandoraea sp. ISTKB]